MEEAVCVGRIGLDTGLSDMTQVNVPQKEGDLTDYREARRRAWMEEYREERREERRQEGFQEGRQEGLQEGLQVGRNFLTRQAARRFGPQTGQRLAEVLADAHDLSRFEQVGDLILDSADGDELLRGLNAEPH